MNKYLFGLLSILLISCGSNRITTSKKIDLIYIESYIYPENWNNLPLNESIYIEQLNEYRDISPINTEHCTTFQFDGGINNYRNGVTIPGAAFKQNIKKENSSCMVHIDYSGGSFNFSQGGDNILDFYINDKKSFIMMPNTFNKSKEYFKINKKGKITLLDDRIKKTGDKTYSLVHYLYNKILEREVKLYEDIIIHGVKENITIKRTIKNVWDCY